MPFPPKKSATSPVGLDEPDDVGAPPPAAAEPPPDDASQGMVSLADMGYFSEPHQCQGCSHFQDGMCEIAQQPVDPQLGCLLFKSANDGSDADLDDSMGAPPPPNGAMPPARQPYGQ